LLAGELRACWWRCDELGGERDHGRPGESGQLAELLGRERCLEWAAPSDDGYVADGGAVQDVEHGGRDVVLVEDVRRCEEHPRHVERDVALTDHGHVLCPVERWCWWARWVLGVPVDEGERGDDAIGWGQGGMQSGDSTAAGEEKVRVVRLQSGEGYVKGM